MICGCGSVYHNCKTTAYGKRYHIIMTNPFDVHDAGHDVLVMETYMYYKIFLSSIDIVYCESRVGAVHGFPTHQRAWVGCQQVCLRVGSVSVDSTGRYTCCQVVGLVSFQFFFASLHLKQIKLLHYRLHTQQTESLAVLSNMWNRN